MCTADDIRDTTANLPITHCAAKAPHFVGYTVTETTVDRNCLFYVLSHQLLSVSGVAKSATCDRKLLNSCVRVLLLTMSCSSVGLIQIITWRRWKRTALGGVD